MNKLHRSFGLLLAAFFMLSSQSYLSAQGQRRGGLFGDWNVTTQFGERSFDSILAFSRDGDGNLTGHWLGFFGVSELSDLSYENNQLAFTRTVQGRNGNMTSKFKGTVENDALNGVFTSEQGESKVTGKRAARPSRAVGDWAMTIKAGEREFTGTMSLKEDAQGGLAGEWTSQRGSSELRDVKYERGNLSFNRTIEMQDNKWEMSFEGTLRGNQLNGVFKSERGEAETTGERVGGAAIGTWNLEVQFDQGARPQRLRIQPDMSALYGATRVDKVALDGNKISFEYAMEFGDRRFAWEFKGVLDGDKLSGELVSDQGSRKVTGQKVVRNFRRNP